jgi:hypothetical protein
VPRNEANKTEFIAVRMSTDAADALRLQAQQSGLSISELIRRRLAGKTVISRIDQETAASIDRLGRMLKHLYPKGRDWASPEDRKRWWSLVTELESIAKALSRSVP